MGAIRPIFPPAGMHTRPAEGVPMILQHAFILPFVLPFVVAATAAGKEPLWVPGSAEVPAGAVFVGSENAYNYFVCRGEHMGAVHPGKLHAGKCNIEFNWGEVVLDTYEVLTELPELVKWVPDSLGVVPPDAFPVGNENYATTYSCAAEVFRKDESGGILGSLGTHAGKVHSTACNIPYGGGAYVTPNYSVLVIMTPVDVKPVRRARSFPGSRDFGTFDLNGRKLAWKRVSAAAGAPYLIRR